MTVTLLRNGSYLYQADRRAFCEMTSGQNTIEIVVIGNELLNGTTLDTNSHWISKRLVRLGAIVTRKTTVRDDLGEISEAFSAAIGRTPSWIFSLGGLGPTYDDMTLKGLSRAVKRPIQRNIRALKIIRESRERRVLSGAKLPMRITQATLKMADLPRGSIPLRNSVGTAPGVLTITGSAKVISLPGVPREMKAIFVEEVQRVMKRELPKFGKIEKWFRTSGITESAIAPYIGKLMKEYSPLIYIKSHPVGFKNRVSILEFQISATYRLDEELKSKKILSEATTELIAVSKKLGGKVDPIR